MAAPGEVEPGRDENPPGESGPLRGEGPPAAGAERAATARQGAAESEEGRERVELPLGEQPSGREHSCGAERTRGGERAPWRDTGDLGEEVEKL